MKSLSLVADKAGLQSCFDEIAAINPSIVFLFGAPSFFRDEETAKILKEKSRSLPLVGCSSAGEVHQAGMQENGIVLVAIHFEKTEISFSSEKIGTPADSFSVAVKVAERLSSPALRAVFVVAPGRGVNGSEITKGLKSVVGKKVVISGGLAADNVDFHETHLLLDGEISSDKIIAVGFYGDAISISCGSEGGWRPFGPARRVTKATGHILEELDGKPALSLYKQYLGEKAKNLPASGLSYPFAILRDDRSMSGLIRSALDIDHKSESLIMAGDVPQGCQVCLMHADTGALIQGAAQAAAESLRMHEGGEENGCALVVNCVGRRIVLGIDADEEIEAIVDSFLPETQIGGFYSYGEISTNISSGDTQLHNQTMTVTYITER